MKTKLFGTDARHVTFKQDLDKLLKKHALRLPATHLLAISAQVTGMIAAMQDQRTMTSEKVMSIVAENIQLGNDGMVDYDIFKEQREYRKEQREYRKERRAERLAKTDEFGWSKHSDTHWYRTLTDDFGLSDKLHYWPSASRWLFKGKYYRGGLPKFLSELIEADNQILREKN